MTEPKKVTWKHYSVPIPLPDNCSWIAEEMREARRWAEEALAGSIFEPAPYVPSTRWQRARSWLGLKLWKLAVWLDSDLID